MTERLAVVVLAGGAGSRMGGAKPRRRLGRMTLVGHALALAQAYGRQVAVAVRDERQVAGAVDARLLLDDPDIEGPLAGLASALAFAREIGADWVLTLPCDSPRLPPDFALRLQQALRLGEAAALARSGGRLHPTCALWRVGCLEALPTYLATGRRSLQGFAATVGMTVIDWPLVGADPFANANTPEELAALQADFDVITSPSIADGPMRRTCAGSSGPSCEVPIGCPSGLNREGWCCEDSADLGGPDEPA